MREFLIIKSSAGQLLIEYLIFVACQLDSSVHSLDIRIPALVKRQCTSNQLGKLHIPGKAF